MSLVINTNVSSLNAQNNLTKSQSALSQATERLSSGLKINSAKDNAAGFAISQRYTTQIGGLGQASANASDAINLAQTAGSALDQVTANLQAIRDLAVQSANGTYGDDDRKSIDQEVQQRLAEITRIANQTTFNGSKVLDGSMKTKSFQIGADVGQTISVNLGTSVKASAMGGIAKTSSGDISAAFSSAAGLTLKDGDLTVDLGDGTGEKNVAAGTYASADDLATAINAVAGAGFASVDADSGELTFDNSTSNAVTFGGSKASSVLGVSTVDAAASGSASDGQLDSTGVKSATDSGSITVDSTNTLTIDGTSVADGSYDTAQDFADAINTAYNTAAGTTGVELATVDSTSGELHFDNATASAVSIGGALATTYGLDAGVDAATPAGTTDGTASSTGVDAAVSAAASTSLSLGAGDLTINGQDITGDFNSLQDLVDQINSTSDLGVSAAVTGDGKGFALYSASDITASTSTTGALGTTSLADASAAQSATNSLQGRDVLNVDDANDLISRVDVALKSVSDFAAQLGAVQNRFQSTISTLAAQTTNLQASQSTIQDADFAAETAALSKAQVLQQAGISVLSQANSNPQQVLKLLQ